MPESNISTRNQRLNFSLRGLKILLATAAGWLVALSAQAQYGINDSNLNVNLGNKPLIETVSQIINIFLGLLGVIAVCLILYGGYLWLTSAGNEEKISRAKRLLSGAVIGLVIIFAAFGIASFIISRLTEATQGGGEEEITTVIPPGGLRGFNVSSVYPKERATQVKLCARVMSTFNEVVSASSVNGNTVKVWDTKNTESTGDDVLVAGSYATNANSFRFSHPDFERDARYRVNISTSVKSSANRSLQRAKDWWFVTGQESDNSLPTVSAVEPRANATEVCRNSPIQVEFSEEMDVTTLTLDNILLTEVSSGAVIPLRDVSVGSDFKTVTLYPQNTLSANTAWRVTLKSGASGIADACGNQLDGNANSTAEGTPLDDYAWTFTTGQTTDCSPTLDSLTPQSGAYGQEVLMRGRNFFLFGEVSFANVWADSASFDYSNNIVCWNGRPTGQCASNEIKVKVPVGAPTGPVKVLVGTQSSNALPFTVTSPFIDYLSPTEGGVGQYVTVRGWNFGTAPGQVKFGSFNGVPPENCSNTWSDTEIVMKVPTGFTPPSPTEVQVITATNAPSNLEGFNVTNDAPGPGLCSINPSRGPVAATVQLAGERFGSAQGASQVLFDTTPTTQPASVWAAGQIDTAVPAMEGGRQGVTVKVAGKKSNEVGFVVEADSGGDRDSFGVHQYFPRGSRVCLNELAGAVFSKLLNQATVTSSTIGVRKTTPAPGSDIGGSLGQDQRYAGQSFVFTPTSGLWEKNSTYQVSLDVSLRSSTGESLAKPFFWIFSTKDCLIPVEQVGVQPASSFIEKNQSENYDGQAYGPASQILSDPVSWSSTQTSIATVTAKPAPSGPKAATAQASDNAGQTDIQAAAAGKAGKGQLNVGAMCPAARPLDFDDNTTLLAHFDGTATVQTAGNISTAPLSSEQLSFEAGRANQGAFLSSVTRYAEPLKQSQIQQRTFNSQSYYFYPYSALDQPHGGNRAQGASEPFAGAWCGSPIILYSKVGTTRDTSSLNCVAAETDIPNLVTGANGRLVNWVNGGASDGLYFTTPTGTDPRSDGKSYFINYTAYPPGSIYYPVKNSAGKTIFNPSQGTYETWLKPKWDSVDGPGQWGAYLLWYGGWWPSERPDWSQDYFNIYLSGNAIYMGAFKRIEEPDRTRLYDDIWSGDPTRRQNALNEVYSYQSGVGWGGLDWKAGEWHHVAFTWEAGKNQVALYVDGRLLGERTMSTLFTSASGQFGVGYNLGSTLDEFRISSAPLSPYSIWQHGCRGGPQAKARLESISPDNGTASSLATTYITIRGENFGSAGEVLIGGQAAPLGCGTWNDREIVVPVPVGLAGSVRVELETSAGKSVNYKMFTVNNVIHPAICLLNPSHGSGGDSLIITGANFGDNRGAAGSLSEVSFQGDGTRLAIPAANITSWSNKSISLKLPASTVRTGDTKVAVTFPTINGGRQDSNPVTFYGDPFITQVAPDKGPVGTWVTIKGGNFGTLPGSTTFACQRVGNSICPTSRILADSLPAMCGETWNDNEIIVQAPQGLISGLVKVRTASPPNLETSNDKSKNFFLDANLPLGPGLCRLNPDKGSVPRGIELIGDNFGAPAGPQDRVQFSNQALPGGVGTTLKKTAMEYESTAYLPKENGGTRGAPPAWWCDTAFNATSPDASGTGIGSCGGNWWEFSFNVAEAGDYSLVAETSNWSGDLASQRIYHHLNVFVDGVRMGDINNLATWPAHQFGGLNLGSVTAGAHLVKVEWDNDWCGHCSPGGNGDSNIILHSVTLTTSSWTNQSIAVTAPAGTISGPVTVVRDSVLVTGRRCVGVLLGGTCLGVWQDVTTTQTLISNPKTFTVVGSGGVPHVTAISPDEGMTQAGLATTYITVKGSGFGKDQGSGRVILKALDATADW
ncbi:MAG: Ig-like domain-containing protein, partial [Candidatus Kerfeldbacteria bacterium]|nr:Ig-like domain-containing protein [Candidatus Kerfeldbacteria bacterium]